MTIFFSHHDRLRDRTGVSRFSIGFSGRQIAATRLRVLAGRVISQTRAACRIIHRAIVTAKTRRLQRERIFNTHESRDPDSDAAKGPQQPLILSDKWDF